MRIKSTNINTARVGDTAILLNISFFALLMQYGTLSQFTMCWFAHYACVQPHLRYPSPTIHHIYIPPGLNLTSLVTFNNVYILPQLPSTALRTHHSLIPAHIFYSTVHMRSSLLFNLNAPRSHCTALDLSSTSFQTSTHSSLA